MFFIIMARLNINLIYFLLFSFSKVVDRQRHTIMWCGEKRMIVENDTTISPSPTVAVIKCTQKRLCGFVRKHS